MTATIRNSALGILFGARTMLAAQGAERGAFKISEQELDGLWQISLVGSDSLQSTTLLRFRREAPSGSGPKPRLAIIDGFLGLQDYERAIGGLPTDRSYDYALKVLHDLQAQGRFRMSQLIVNGANSVFRSVDGDQVTRIVPFGSDPTSFRVNGRACEVLAIYFFRLPGSIRRDGKNPTIVTAHVKAANLPDVDTARGSAAKIQRMTGQSSIRIAIRTDTWFLEAGKSPLWYPFEPLAVPPRSHSEYAARGEVYCDGDERGIRCSPMTVFSR